MAALIVAAFQIVRAVGKKSLTSKAEEAAPDLNLVRASESLTEEEETKWQEGWVKYNGSIYAYNEDIRTFLFMGIDKKSDVKEVEEGTKGGQADALFLAVMNPHDKTLKIVGINRNTMADVDIYNDSGAYVTTQKAQIAVQHGFGNGVEESCEYQKKAVSRLFYGLPIHGYAAINMSAIPTINDAVGGVDVTVLDDLTKYDSSLKKDAKVHLMGEALLVCEGQGCECVWLSGYAACQTEAVPERLCTGSQVGSKEGYHRSPRSVPGSGATDGNRYFRRRGSIPCADPCRLQL